MKRRSTMTDAFLEEVKNAKADFIKSFSLTKKFLNKLDKKIKEVERREWSSGYCKGRRVENPNWREKNRGKEVETPYLQNRAYMINKKVVVMVVKLNWV